MELKIQSEVGVKTYTEIKNHSTINELFNKELLRFYTSFNRINGDVIVTLTNKKNSEDDVKVVISKQHITYSFGGITTTLQVGLLQQNRIVEFVQYLEETVRKEHSSASRTHDKYELTIVMSDSKVYKSTMVKDNFEDLHRRGLLKHHFKNVSILIAGESIADTYTRKYLFTFD